MNKKLVKLFSLLLCMSFIISMLPKVNLQAKTIVEKKTNKKYKMIESKTDLAEEFRKHVFNLDSSFKIFVSSEAVKDLPKEFNAIWKLISKDDRFVELWKYNTKYKSKFYNYTETKAKCWEWNVENMKFSISKEVANKILKDDGSVITSMDELVKAYSDGILSMADFFSLKISKNVIKNYEKDYKRLQDKLKKNPSIKSVLKYGRIDRLTPFNYKNYWKWNILTDFSTLSKETSKDVMNNKVTFIKSSKQLRNEFIKKLKRHDERIILKMDKEVIDFKDGQQHEKFWKESLANNEFKKAYSMVNNKSFKDKLVQADDYSEWIIDVKYKK